MIALYDLWERWRRIPAKSPRDEVKRHSQPMSRLMKKRSIATGHPAASGRTRPAGMVRVRTTYGSMWFNRSPDWRFPREGGG